MEIVMVEVTATEFQQNVGLYSDKAMREPVIIKSHGREKLVLMDIEDYEQFKVFEEKQKSRENLIDKIIKDHKKTLVSLADR